MGLIDTITKFRPAGIGPSRLDATYASWPKCYRCAMRLRREFAVTLFGDLEIERPTMLRSSHRVSFAYACHGTQERRAVLELPRVFGPASVAQAMGRVFVFTPNDKPRIITADKWLKLAQASGDKP